MNQLSGQFTTYTKPPLTPSQSDVSEATSVSLGKRVRETDEDVFAMPTVLKRVKKSDESNLSEEIPHSTLDAIKLQDNDVTEQKSTKSRSAPTSNNGSMNMCPVLDIQVNLLSGDVSVDPASNEEESEDEKQKR
jgi:hypothetical protein